MPACLKVCVTLPSVIVKVVASLKSGVVASCRSYFVLRRRSPLQLTLYKFCELCEGGALIIGAFGVPHAMATVAAALLVLSQLFESFTQNCTLPIEKSGAVTSTLLVAPVTGLETSPRTP